MKKASDILISLFRYDLFGTPLDTDLPDDLNGLYEIAKKHDMSHLLWHALWKSGYIDRNGESEVISAMKKMYMIAVYRCERQSSELERIRHVLNKENIPFIPLKGMIMRDLWPEPWMRTCGDIDIMLKEQDIPRAQDALCKDGYTFFAQTPHDISLIAPNKVHVELHRSMVEQNRAGNSGEILRDVWAHASSESGGFEYRLDSEFFCFYHIAHMAKHFESGGCGIRTFIDLQYILSKMNVNRAELDTLLENSGLVNFFSACEQMCKIWFENKAMTDRDKTMQNYIMCGGTYGSVKNRVANTAAGSRSGISYIISRLFLPKVYLRERYPVLKQKPYLVPVMQVRRWMDMLTEGRTDRAVRELKYISNSNNDSIKDLMKELGL